MTYEVTFEDEPRMLRYVITDSTGDLLLASGVMMSGDAIPLPDLEPGAYRVTCWPDGEGAGSPRAELRIFEVAGERPPAWAL